MLTIPDASDFTIVVRSVLERTEETCLEIAKSQIGLIDKIHVIRNKVFAEAHLESMKFVIESDTKWAIFLDADVLLKGNAILEMLSEAQSIATPFYMLNFQVLDRGFGGPSYAGVHLYNTRNVIDALQYEDIAYASQRPESQLCIEMARREGIPTLLSNRLVGLHGYEQYYADIYRTSFVRAVKFKTIRENLLSRYRVQYPEYVNQGDQDGKVMFWGLVDGMLHARTAEKAPLNKDFYRERAACLLNMLELEEKGELVFQSDKITKVFEDYRPDAHYRAIQDVVCRSDSTMFQPSRCSFGSRLRQHSRRTFLTLGSKAKKAVLALTAD